MPIIIYEDGQKIEVECTIYDPFPEPKKEEKKEEQDKEEK